MLSSNVSKDEMFNETARRLLYIKGKRLFKVVDLDFKSGILFVEGLSSLETMPTLLSEESYEKTKERSITLTNCPKWSLGPQIKH